MTVIKAYSTPASFRRMHFYLLRYISLIAFFAVVLSSFRVVAQGIPEYDEISVFLEVPRVGGGEISAVIRGEELFLPVTDLFDFLKIRNVPPPDWNPYQVFLLILKLNMKLTG